MAQECQFKLTYMHEQIGKIFIIGGIFIIIIGFLIFFFGHKLSWFGHLPGDILVEKENLKIYIPITTMILMSIFLTLLIHFLKKFF
jgi:Protein of unknown function (DUF2905)